LELHRPDETPTARGRADWFTGAVWLDRIVQAPPPARARAYRVSFEPGARTARHTHPLGQTLHVLSGFGLAQARGGPAFPIRAGDTVWIPPGEEHWHGAAPASAMAHLAIQEAADEDGAEAAWLEQVADSEYRAAAAAVAAGPA
jgi:quercetin dioxygenase-like cupin family protein